MYDIAIRNKAIANYQNGKSVTSISRELGISQTSIHKWISLYVPHRSKPQNIEFIAAQFLAIKRKLEKTEREKLILMEAYSSLKICP